MAIIYSGGERAIDGAEQRTDSGGAPAMTTDGDIYRQLRGQPIPAKALAA